MSSEDVLRSTEASALSNNQIISSVAGINAESGNKKKLGAFTAGAFITAALIMFVGFFSIGTLTPVAISERLVEQTDVQYADAMESKALVFQQALANGELPENTIQRLRDNGVLVGNMQDGSFTESTNGTALKIGDRVIPASNFITEVNANVNLYEAFNNATYSRAAYYYDDSAKAVFKKIGTSRNNYTADSDFDEVMSKLTGEGSSISVNNVETVTHTRTNEAGEEETYQTDEEIGARTSSGGDAAGFVNTVSSKNRASSATEATLNAADTINVADAIAKEQKSSLFFLAFMENISKMKAGEGNNSKINEAMNFLYESEESQVVDVNTGEVVTVTGSVLESPSLYAILSGEKIDTAQVENYSSDRVLITVENRLAASATSDNMAGTVTSTSSKITGSIGRFNIGMAGASEDVLSKVTPTVNSSLVDNSFGSIKGIYGGEMLVEGAINVGKELAKASGATSGSAEAVKSYARLTSAVLAMDAEVDRRSRSPFDASSRNTFLGSIVYNLAVSLGNSNTLLGKMGLVLRTAGITLTAMLPATYADDNEDLYLANFGNCKTLGNIGAVGSAGCSVVATFDTSTLSDTFNDPEFIAFVNNNTTLSSSGVRTINNGSDLANFIVYNDERITPAGVTDGGILDALNGGSGKIPFVSNILNMIKEWLGANEAEKRIASGASFVNSSANPDWQTYKYAQRYVSLARATAALKQYDGGTTAYNNIRFFEGDENPVIAFLNEYYNSIAQR